MCPHWIWWPDILLSTEKQTKRALCLWENAFSILITMFNQKAPILYEWPCWPHFTSPVFPMLYNLESTIGLTKFQSSSFNLKKFHDCE